MRYDLTTMARTPCNKKFEIKLRGKREVKNLEKEEVKFECIIYDFIVQILMFSLKE